jgi:hypothetical protein
MNLSWTIAPVYLIILSMLGLVIVFLDFYRQPKSYRPLRISFWMLTLLCLYALIIPPSFQRQPPSQHVIVANNMTIADSLRTTETRVFDSFKAWLKKRNQLNADTLILVGEGLSDWQLAAIDQPFGFVPKPIEEGILDLHLDHAFANVPFTLKGELICYDPLQLSVILPDGTDRRLEVSQRNNFFEMDMSIAIAGNTSLQLFGLRDLDTVFRETYPIMVHHRPEMHVMMISSFPTFESRYLTEWISKQGFRMISYQQLSEKEQKVSFYNRPNNPGFRLTFETIQATALIIIDGKSFQGLNRSLRKEIVKQSQLGNLGLMLLGDVNTVNNDFANLETYASPNRTISLQTQNGLASLNVYPHLMKGEEIAWEGIAIGTSKQQKFGKLIQPNFSDTYRLILKGSTAEYHDIWNKLLSQALGHVTIQRQLIKDPFAKVGSRHDFTYENEVPENACIESSALFPKQSHLLPNQYEYSYWPQMEGWSPLLINDSIVDQVFHGSENAWKTRKLHQALQLTQLASRNSISTEKKTITVKTVLDSIWVYLVLVVSLGILWIEHRVRT